MQITSSVAADDDPIQGSSAQTKEHDESTTQQVPRLISLPVVPMMAISRHQYE